MNKKLLIKLFSYIIAAFIPLHGAYSNVAFNRLQLESFFKDRIEDVVKRVDPNALIRVELKLKKIQSVAPLLGYELDVIPLESDQSIGADSIQQINVVVLSEQSDFPNWIKAEIRNAVILDKVKINITYQKADQPLVDPRANFSAFARSELFDVIKTNLVEFSGNSNWLKYGVWSLVLVAFITLSVIAAGLFGFSSRLEKTLKVIVDEKLIPALSSINLSGGKRTVSKADNNESQSVNPSNAVSTQLSGAKNEFEDMSTEALKMLLTDCYWTSQDGYAHFIWSQLKNVQRESLLKSNFVDKEYFSFIRSVKQENLAYHSDVKYLTPTDDFNFVDQHALQKWVKTNMDKVWAISPLRLDFLELSLEDRVKMFLQPQKKTVAAFSVAKTASNLRELPPQFRVKRLTEKDEEFLWDNHAKIPQEARSQLNSLVWLGLAPDEYIKNIFSELDARQIAEAWSAPHAVLEKFKSIVPPKKMEMVEHFLATSTPDRTGEVFAYLVEAGQKAPNEVTPKQEAA